jgi:hypothetical protein
MLLDVLNDNNMSVGRVVASVTGFRLLEGKALGNMS